jgi:serine/threonine-protein phosphatase 6 regulatory ankyrin repeat subunit B
MEAAEYGSAKAITALCKAGALPNQADKDGWTPLMIAAHGGHAQAILALCAAGATPNQAKSDDGWTALMCAAKKGRIEAITALCKTGALPNQADKDGWTPLMCAAEFDHAGTITALCKTGALPNQAMPDGTTPLIIAAEHDRARAITALCNAGALVNQADENGETPLMHAAEYGNVRAISALCKAGALLNQADKNGMTPLMFAAQFGHLGALNQLLLHQADPCKTSLVKLSCILAVAGKQDRQKAVKTLIKQQPPKWTALDVAVFFGHQKIVTVLLDKMPDVDIKTLDKLYKLAQAINHTIIMDILKERKMKSASIKKAKEKPAKISNGTHSSTFFKDTADDVKKSKEQSHIPSSTSTSKVNAFQ